MILRLDDFARHFKVRRSEWLLAFVAFSIGMAYLSTPRLFEAEQFEQMQLIAPQATWGWSITVVALLRLAMLWVNGRWHVSPYFRASGAFLCAGLWFMLLSCQSFSTAPPQTRWVWLALVIFDLMNAGDAAFDAGVASAQRGRDAER
jgi:hypothetical protein